MERMHTEAGAARTGTAQRPGAILARVITGGMAARAVLFCCLACGLCAASGCGRKGDPFLGVPLGPSKVRQLTAVGRPAEIVLSWQAPRDNTDDSDLLDLGGFRIYRAQSSFADYCRSCPRRYELLFDYEYRGPSGQKPERRMYQYRDSAVAPGTVYEYRLQAYNAAGAAGPAPEPVAVHYDAAPRPPQDVALERSGRLIVLGWQKVSGLADGRAAEDIAGYNVYRRLDTEEYAAPLNAAPVAEPRFEDIPPAYDTVYYYSVRAVRRIEQSVLESDGAPEIRLAYLDMTPPEPPRFLTAIAQPEGVLLKWMAKSEKGFAGYHVYRRTAGAGQFKRLNAGLLTENSWVDTTAVRRQRYEYAVSAVDDSKSANESAFGETVYIHYVLD